MGSQKALIRFQELYSLLLRMALLMTYEEEQNTNLPLGLSFDQLFTEDMYNHSVFKCSDTLQYGETLKSLCKVNQPQKNRCWVIPLPCRF